MSAKQFCIIIPYIGNLPIQFNAFVDSARKNDKIDFFIFSDQEAAKKYASENIHVTYMTLQEIRLRCPVGLNGGLKIPYKLCDFKPLYGEIFQEYISDYEFWGYCDVDLILGDLQSYLASIDLSQFDRLFDLGHLTFYRNTPQINHLWAEDNCLKLKVQYILNTTIACNFDEVGMNKICHNELGKRWLHELRYIDVYWWHDSFRYQGIDWLSFPQLFVHYPNGKLFHLIKKSDGETEKREVCYIHCFRRKFYATNDILLSTPYLITHKGFRSFDEKRIEAYFKEFESDADGNKAQRKKMQHTLRRALWMKLYNELKYNGLIKGLRNSYIKLINR